MKVVIASVILLCITLQTHAQVRARISDEQLFYLKKSEKYRRMKTRGMTAAIAGTGLIVGGIITISKNTYTSNGQTMSSNDEKVRNGIIAYLVGVAGVGAGVPLWIVGGINQNRYSKKLDQSTFGLRVSPEHAGISLSYRF